MAFRLKSDVLSGKAQSGNKAGSRPGLKTPRRQEIYSNGEESPKEKEGKEEEEGSEQGGLTSFSGTASTRQLCRRISRMTGGVCFLALSLGKDSLASWLFIRKYFKKVIPYTALEVPGFSFDDEIISHYEDFFKTKIIRVMSGNAVECLMSHFYQPPEDYVRLESMDLWQWDLEATEDLLMKRFKIPEEKCWIAHGVSINDNLPRRLAIMRKPPEERGINRDWNRFYPIWDWRIGDLLSFIENAGCCLSDIYTLYKTSLVGIPEVGCLYGMRDKRPKDFERLKLLLPLIEASIARNEFRKYHQGAAI